jgi:transketolase
MVIDMREAFVSAATALVEEDERVSILLADISSDRFWDAIAEHPDRVVNVGIREQLLVSAAAGMALDGRIPIAHTYAPFLIERAFEQIKLDLTHQDVAAVLVSVGASFDSSTSGRTHQCPGDVALLDTLDDWTIDVPGHEDEVAPLLERAVRDGRRTYLRLSTAHNAQPRPTTGRFEVVRRGERATIVAVGPMLDPVMDATSDLDVTVLYASTIRPFDGETLRRAVTADTADVVLVEPYLAGTSAAEVSRVLAHVPHRLLSLGVTTTELRRYGSPKEHQVAHRLGAAGLAADIPGFLEKRAA